MFTAMIVSMRQTDFSRFILGIDPGSINSGYAFIRGRGRGFHLLDSGVCELDSKTDFFDRLSLLSDFFSKLLKNLPPFELAIESLVYVKNANSFGKLAQARGVIITVLQPKAVKIHEYPPNLVKSTVSGYGHSTKQNIKKSLGFSDIKKDFKTHDESDALAVALCHHFHGGYRVREIGKSPSGQMKSVFKGKNP